MYWRQLLIPTANGRPLYTCPTGEHHLFTTTPKGKCKCFTNLEHCKHLQSIVARFGCCGGVTIVRRCSLFQFCTQEQNEGLIEYHGITVASCALCDANTVNNRNASFQSPT